MFKHLYFKSRELYYGGDYDNSNFNNNNLLFKIEKVTVCVTPLRFLPRWPLACLLQQASRCLSGGVGYPTGEAIPLYVGSSRYQKKTSYHAGQHRVFYLHFTVFVIHCLICEHCLYLYLCFGLYRFYIVQSSQLNARFLIHDLLTYVFLAHHSRTSVHNNMNLSNLLYIYKHEVYYTV